MVRLCPLGGVVPRLPFALPLAFALPFGRASPQPAASGLSPLEVSAFAVAPSLPGTSPWPSPWPEAAGTGGAAASGPTGGFDPDDEKTAASGAGFLIFVVPFDTSFRKSSQEW